MMKGMKNISNKINRIYRDLLGICEEIEYKMDALDDNASEHDRDLTAREQAIYDNLDEVLDSLRNSIEELEYAMGGIE